ncbi:MAG: selenocysteine-specific translation elongation factor [Gemmatimonadetes bacterium]|nr:selenocysteine-specific translation elongation factor [Gemmatimonadota bacterium]
MSGGVIVGTGGHVDHGKTSLVRALTGVETDRWAEERERGLTIDIGFAPLDSLTEGEAGVVDVPGHEDFIRNMLAGSTGVDVLMLVVAADEGPMPQTREHLTIARLLGIRAGVVALNKIDKVDDEWLELVRETTRDEVSKLLGHSDWPIVDVSATTGEGLPDLREALSGAAARAVRRESADLFRMPVDRSFSVRGAGTVVTGTTWSGQLKVGDTARVLPEDVTARVRSLQVHGKEREEVGAGLRCAMALVGIPATGVDRGSVVVGAGNWRPLDRLGVRLEIPPASAREVTHGQRVRLFIGTGEVMARVRTADRGAVLPGGQGWAVLDCERPVVARVRDRFVLRFYSPVTTVGGGQICELVPPRGWRTRVDGWSTILDGEPHEAVVAAVDATAGAGLAVEDVALETGLPASTAESFLAGNSGVIRVGGSWYSRASVEGATAAVLETLRRAHKQRRRSSSESLESVRASLSARFSPYLVDEVIAGLASSEEIVVEGPGIRLAGHEPGLSGAERRILASLEDVLTEAGLAPPSPADLAAELETDRDLLNDLLKLLLERGKIIRVTPEIYVTRRAEESARRTIESVARSGAVGPGEFREALGLTRRYLIPLLEYMDGAGVTRRTAEGRVLQGSD